MKEQAECGVFYEMEFYEMVAVADVWWECFNSRFHEVSDVVWEMVGGAITYW